MKTLLLLSGGTDSSLCLHRFAPVLAVGYDYGQRALIELTHAERRANHCGVPFEVVRLPELPLINSTSLVRAGRNAVMLAHAASIAQARGIDEVMIGCNATDAERFPDCRLSFLASMQEALHGAYGVMVHAPLLYVTKQQILAECTAHGITDTWSCYTPRDGKPCGECYACQQGRP